MELNELEEKYDLQLDRIVEQIKKKKAKKVLLQFPDGMKPYSVQIADIISEKLNGKISVTIWLGSCYGACDVPAVEKDVLIVQFGHAPWNFE